MKTFLRRNRTALILSLFYFVPGLLWVLFLDSWLSSPAGSPEVERFKNMDRLKDASFVVAVSIMIFFILRLSRKKLVQEREQYENLFDENPQPMWIYDKETLRFMAVNNAAVIQYGYTKDEFRAMTIADIRPAEDIALLEAYRALYQPGQKSLGIWHHLKKNGEQILAEVSASDVTFKNRSSRLVCTIDITERAKNKNELQKLSLVAEHATNSIIILDEQARIQWVNKSFTTLTGFSLEEVQGKRPPDFLHGPLTDQQVRREVIRCCKEGKPFSGEIINYRKDGSTFWLRLMVSPVFTDGCLSNFVTVQTDITAIKEQYIQLKDIAFTASHGLRKPLANILGLVDLIHVNGNDLETIENLRISAEALDQEVSRIVKKTALN